MHISIRHDHSQFSLALQGLNNPVVRPFETIFRLAFKFTSIFQDLLVFKLFINIKVFDVLKSISLSFF